jgi:hypothetical protein
VAQVGTCGHVSRPGRDRMLNTVAMGLNMSDTGALAAGISSMARAAPALVSSSAFAFSCWFVGAEVGVDR